MNGYSLADVQTFVQQMYATQIAAGRALQIVPYGYTVSFTSLAQNATSTQQLTITGNADFVLTEIAHRAAISAAQTVSTKTAPFARLLITDNGSSEKYTDSGVDLENYSTNGVGARRMPYPRFIAGRTSLSLQLTNYAPTAETYSSIDIYLSGVLCRLYG